MFKKEVIVNVELTTRELAGVLSALGVFYTVADCARDKGGEAKKNVSSAVEKLALAGADGDKKLAKLIKKIVYGRDSSAELLKHMRKEGE